MFRPKGRQRTAMLAVAAILGVLSIWSYTKFGKFHETGRKVNTFHYHDIWHYALGAKYFPELGYDSQYDCTAVALDELRREGVRVPPISSVRVLENPMTHYELRTEMPRLRTECADRFTDDRWQAFKDDQQVWLSMPWQPRWWQVMLFDLGFNPPPTWNVIAHTTLDVVPITKFTLKAFPFIDMFLIFGVGGLVVWRTWGSFALAGYLLVLGTNYTATYSWTGGSYMRQLWFPALVCGLAAVRTERWRLAGVLVALAALMRVFPAVFIAGAGLAVLGMWWRGELERRDVLEFTGAGVATGLVMVVLSLLMFDPSLWADFFRKIQDHGDTYFVWHIGFKKWATWSPAAAGQDFWWGPGLVRFQHWNDMLHHAWESGRWFYEPLRLGMIGLAAALAWRERPDRAALLLGGTAMFCLTIPANYYYVWLALLPAVYFDEEESHWTAHVRFIALFATLAVISISRFGSKDGLVQNSWWNWAMFWFFVTYGATSLLERDAVRAWLGQGLRTRWKEVGAVSLAVVALVTAARTIDLDPRKNLVLILIDTIRADRLGVYGYDRDTSPKIDAWAKEATVFEHAYSHAPWTAPSVASIMTSMVPRDHGLVDWDMKLDAQHLTLAEHLQGEGYQTMAAISHVVFREALGFQQGFDEYDTTALDLGHPEKAVSSKVVTDVAIQQLEGRRGNQPFFLWAHYFDPHFQYTAHKGLTFPRRNPRSKRRVDAWSDTYDSEVKWTDRHVGRLLDYLDRQGLMEDSVVVLVGDHGEEFGDHGGERHSVQLFDEVVRVPFILRAPGVKGGRIAQTIPTSDLGPTVLPLMGVDTPSSFDGAAVPNQGGQLHMADSRPVILETIRFADKRGWVQWPWKLVQDREKNRLTLYDLNQDPKERRDMGADHPEIRNALLEKIDAHYSGGRKAAPSRELSDEELEQLKALGYMDDHGD